jgi:hypothetical protein
MPSDPTTDLAAEVARLNTELLATQCVFAVFSVFQNGFDGKFDPASLGIDLPPDQSEHFKSTVETLLGLAKRIEHSSGWGATHA